MSFKPTADTPIKKLDDGSGIEIVSGPGGSPWVTDPVRPHLGGNFDGGDLGTWYKEDLWPWLIEKFDVKSMVDVGCGTGETVRWFAQHGCVVAGVDGLPWNVQKCRERGPELVAQHDFTVDGPCLFDGRDFICDGSRVKDITLPIELVDLIWCADVVEHIAEEYVDNILQTLRQGKVLAMCQGTEANANDGWHHVNNQPESYWVEKLAAVGMVEDVEMTAQSRVIGNHGWWQGTGRIYRRAA